MKYKALDIPMQKLCNSDDSRLIKFLVNVSKKPAAYGITTLAKLKA